jgi:5-(carboxyamino)imidazole ribonucleotide synthase
MADGALIANEMAPRVHNSGHWTIEGALTSQFEQHIRAIAGWPLGDTTRIAGIEMLNLIGEDAGAWATFANEAGAHLHLYAKRDTRAGRKMGHVTRLLRR